MSLTRDELIEIAVDKYFIGLNEHNVPKATDIMSEDCIMRFSAAKFRYEGRAANIVHLTEFTTTYKIINFHNFVNIVDPEAQSIATRFHIDLLAHDGDTLSMSNCNWFEFNADGLISDILIYNAAPLQKGFEAGSVV